MRGRKTYTLFFHNLGKIRLLIVQAAPNMLIKMIVFQYPRSVKEVRKQSKTFHLPDYLSFDNHS